MESQYIDNQGNNLTPYNVAKDVVYQCGGAFSVGTLMGTIWYFTNGYILSPKGQKLMGGLIHTRNRATALGGSVAMWSFCFNMSRGMLSYYRQKDDKWSACFGGFMSGVIVNARASLYFGISQGAQFAAMFYFIFSLSEKTASMASKME